MIARAISLGSRLLGALVVTFVFVAALLFAGGPINPAKADAEGDRLSWEAGIVAIPGNEKCSFRRIGDGDVQKNCFSNRRNAGAGKLPAVIFLHGCDGINNRQTDVMGLFIQNGYPTFMPDSMVRSERSTECGSAREYIHLRFDDINYALSQIRKIPWIDHKRLVLAGFSAGGISAAQYQDYDFAFKARVIMGWGCRGMSPIAVLVPFLNLVGSHDDETRRGNQLCSAGGDSIAKHVSSGHDISEDSASAKLIGAFLKKFL